MHDDIARVIILLKGVRTMAELVGPTNLDGWECTEWNMTIANDGKRSVFKYRAGMAHTGTPDAADVLGCLLLDASAGCAPLDEYLSEFLTPKAEYEEISKATKTWRLCQSTYAKITRLLGEDLVGLALNSDVLGIVEMVVSEGDMDMGKPQSKARFPKLMAGILYAHHLCDGEQRGRIEAIFLDAAIKNQHMFLKHADGMLTSLMEIQLQHIDADETSKFFSACLESVKLSSVACQGKDGIHSAPRI